MTLWACFVQNTARISIQICYTAYSIGQKGYLAMKLYNKLSSTCGLALKNTVMVTALFVDKILSSLKTFSY